MSIKDFKFDITDNRSGNLVLDAKNDCGLFFSESRQVVVLTFRLGYDIISGASAEIPEGKTAAEIANMLIPDVLNIDAIIKLQEAKRNNIKNMQNQIEYLDSLRREIGA